MEPKMTKSLILVAICLILALNNAVIAADTKVHIVYLGERLHDDPELVTESHHQMLWSILGSKEAAHDSMVYSYRHGFSAFAAKLTDSQVQQLSELPEVVHVIRDRFYQLQTTRTWDYLQHTSKHPKNLLNQTNMGDQVIIGVVDSGVWPESKSFNDNGLGPIPKRWKGACVSRKSFNGSAVCNRKLIGAKYFISGALLGGDESTWNTTKDPEYISPRDFNGHGTHVAATAAGSFIPNTSYLSLGRGIARGGAPRARVAMYKACWHIASEGTATCSEVDLLKAIDEAIHDGVDVLSISISFSVPLFSEVGTQDGIAVGAFHAITKGIPVVCSAGNEGPASQTITNTAPWIITVAATTQDRSFPTLITLGNNITIVGQALYQGPVMDFTSLVYPERPDGSNETFSGICEDLSINPARIIKGKIVLCFTRSTNYVFQAAVEVVKAGGIGVIVAMNPGYLLTPCGRFPCLAVDYELGTDILFYIRSTRSPVAKIKQTRTLIGLPVATKVATFSARGPSSISPAILKPDIAAPGVNIVAATSPNDTFNFGGFTMKSGTSMSTPVVSGVVALLKSLHPHWSPAAIRSAIVTTAWRTDPSGEPIFADGSNRKLADPFDYGGGVINSEKAAKPGLIYDMDVNDYVHYYLCSVGYTDSSISRLIRKKTVCKNPRSSVLDLNLPSITIPNLKKEVIMTRTVTNVGPVDSVYKVMIEAPMGVNVTVTPKMLVFNGKTKKLSFKVIVSTTHRVNSGYYFGSLTWTDSVHNVVIPVSVRTQIIPRYHDEN